MNVFLSLSTEPWVHRLGWTLLHFLWQGAGIALLLAMILRLLTRASAQARYVLIGAALLLCAVTPLATWILLGPPPVSSALPVLATPSVFVPAVKIPRAVEPASATAMISWSQVPTSMEWPEKLKRISDATLPYLVALWFIGVLILTARLTLGWTLMQRMCLSGTAIQDASCRRRFHQLMERMQIRVPVRLLESALVDVPTLIGWLRPVILVPASIFIGLTPDQLEAILAHELAHIRRYDYLLNLFQTVIETALFYHPAVWWIGHKLREERENCCDDIALDVLQNRLVYVSALAQLEQARATPLAMTASGGSLLQRVRRIVGANDRKVSAWPLWVLIACLLFAGCLAKKGEPSTRVEFQVSGQMVQLSAESQKEVIGILEELLVIRYINGTPDDVFHWQQIPDSSIEKIRKSGSYLHLAYAKEQIFKMGGSSFKTKDVWVGLQENSPGDSYPGNPGGVMVVRSDKAEAFNLFGGSKSLLIGLGLNPEIYPHLPDGMKKTLDENRKLYQTYLDWSSLKDAAGQPINQQVIIAVQAGDAAALQKLIAQGAEVKAIKGDCPTLLFRAASPEVVQLLLDHGVDPNAHDDKSGTALCLICRDGGKNVAAMARLLLQHGADVNARWGESGLTPLMVAHDGATVDVLMEYGADLKLVTPTGQSVVESAARGSFDSLEALLRHGAVFDPKTDGPTMLVMAAWSENVPMLKWLLEHGVDPNSPGVFGSKANKQPLMMPPLQAAIVSGQTETVKLLLAHGAKAEGEMITALHNRRIKIVKLLWESGVRSISELCYAVSQGAPVGDLQKLLEKGGPVDPPQDKQITPLGLAALLGNMDAVKLFIAHHADVNAGAAISTNPKFKIATRMSPLWLAASEGQDEIVEYLLQHGAVTGPAALWQAAENSFPYLDQRSKDHFEKTVRMLIDAGALKTVAPEMAGMILSAPIQTRQGLPNPAVLKMLLDAGMDPEVPMPYIEDNGEKPNSVIGYYREYYSKNKDDPTYAPAAERIKPLLEMLEAADKHADAGVPKPSTSAITFASQLDGCHITDLKVTDMPLPDFVRKISGMLKESDPNKMGVKLDLEIPPGEPPITITMGFPPRPWDVINLLARLKDLYPINYRVTDDSVKIVQLSHAETEFNRKAAATKINLDLHGVDAVAALKTVQSEAAVKGFAFDLDLEALKAQAPASITLKVNGWSVEHCLLSIFYQGELVPAPLQKFTGYHVSPGSIDELHKRTWINYQMRIFTFRADDAEGIAKFLANPPQNLGGAGLTFPAYPYRYAGLNFPAGTQWATTGYVVEGTDGELSVGIRLTPGVIDKAHIQVTSAVEVTTPNGSTRWKTLPDGAALGKTTRQWTQKSGTIVSLLFDGKPLVVESEGDGKSTRVVYLLTQVKLVNAEQEELNVEPPSMWGTGLELIPSTGDFDRVDFAKADPGI
jgi:beta-lactamase regulating signal transducer with metallopeptidase domain/ankyrin repeat protein